MKLFNAHTVALSVAAAIFALAWPAAALAQTTVPVSASVGPDTSLTLSVDYGDAAFTATSAMPAADSSLSSITFPNVTAPSSGTTPAVASDWFGVTADATGTGLTSSTTWSLSGAVSNLTNTATSTDTIPASDVQVNGPTSANPAVWTGTSSGADYDFDTWAGTSGVITGSSTSSTWVSEMYVDNSGDNETTVVIQPQLNVPSGTANGTYMGNITISGALS